MVDEFKQEDVNHCTKCIDDAAGTDDKTKFYKPASGKRYAMKLVANDVLEHGHKGNHFVTCQVPIP